MKSKGKNKNKIINILLLANFKKKKFFTVVEIINENKKAL